ncbi:YdcF family protein [Emticicia agri]|uniref:YdcF family protein n=1 Tax=Emticicia agri TaxID=2492393 RepID=A0A4Q5M3C3_9BACT|nr:YdcF family protein [Emticicia agri]RYU96818.1 YdcF family protein [Emticicia agri]
MFHIVSKLLTFFLMPAGIICILLIYAIYTKNRTKSRKVILTTLIFFYFFSTPFIINEVFLWWELPPTAISTVKPHEVGILLTGGTINTNRLPTENVFLGGTSDRIGQAIQLYKLGKIKTILISGGDVPILGKTTTREIDQIARFLMISGVPREVIFLEDHSTNTRENAVNVSKILKKQFPNQRYMLITSAFHLKRAVGCFEKAGIPVTPYGSNYISGERQWVLISFLPKAEAMGYLQWIFREVVGYVSYRIFGWI